MARRPAAGALRFRVRVPPSHPLWARLAALPERERPAALLAAAARGAPQSPSAEQPGQPAGDPDPGPPSGGGPPRPTQEWTRVADALDRIAAALERLAEGGPVAAGQAEDRGRGRRDPRMDNLLRAWGEDDDEP